MRRGIAAGLGGMALLGCGLAGWAVYSGQVESLWSRISGAVAVRPVPAEPATLQALTWCGRRHPEAVAMAQPQGQLVGGDPDVEAGFTGHDAEELTLGAAINEQIDISRSYYGQIVGIGAANLAAAGTSDQSKPGLPVPPQSGHASEFMLPLRNLTDAERSSLCVTLATMRQSNVSLAGAIALINEQ